MGAFELTFPNQGETERRITVEFAKETGDGTLRFETRKEQPGYFKTVEQEKIHCEVD